MTLLLSETKPLTTPDRVRRLARADIINVRATPTARALLAGSVVMAAASCLANLASVTEGALSDAQMVELAMHASTVATLVFAMVAGVVSATADFRFGRIDQLLLSEPNRSIVVTAKESVAMLTGFVYGTIGSITAVAVTAAFFAAKGIPLDLLSEQVVLPVIGLLLGAALFGAFGIAIGIAVRNQPAALAGSLAWLLIVEPTALLGLPDVGRWFPGAAGLALTRSPDENLLGQVPGAVLLVAWTAVAIVVALVRFGALRARPAAEA